MLNPLMNLIMVVMFTFLATGWSVLSKLISGLVGLGIAVGLPVLLFRQWSRNRKHEVDRKSEILLKAVEKGQEIDPAFFADETPKKTVKDKLMGRLTAACICTLIGLFASAALLISGIRDGWDIEWAILLIPACAALAVGIAFFIVYFVGRKTYAKALAKLDAKPQ